MKLSKDEFRSLFKSGGEKLKKGRPFIPIDDIHKIFDDKPKVNRRVTNATEIFDHKGNKVADSKWEYKCKLTMENANLKFEYQRKFELIPTIRQAGLRTLRKRTWAPDFVFEEYKIVADAKGFITEMARIKVQLFLYLYPDWKVVLIKNETDLYNFINQIKQINNG